MHFERIKTPGIAHVAYLFGAEGEAVVVDPRRDVDEYITAARRNKLTIKFIFETHRQEDFVIGSKELAKLTGAGAGCDDRGSRNPPVLRGPQADQQRR